MLVFYAQSTGTIISGRFFIEGRKKKHKQTNKQKSIRETNKTKIKLKDFVLQYSVEIILFIIVLLS